MPQLNLADVVQYVEENIGNFHKSRLDGLNKLVLTTVLRKKNPYLYKAKNLLLSQDIIRTITDAYISSGEETKFGNWLEELAIFINSRVYDGKKSAARGIDLEFDLDGVRNIVAIKSGPNWGNSSQINKMKTDFTAAGKTLRTSNGQIQIKAINGCCYGRDNNPDKGDYFKYCGQRFWSYISNDPDLYTKIIEPLGHRAQEKNDEFNEAYAQIINKFTGEFTEQFVKADGTINWTKLVQFNSGNDGPDTDPEEVVVVPAEE